ncbi:MAG: hypothetical protein J5691_00670 [Bacilli bacterium]|nr:hypothetical protein [Bacilli bacterium]
MYMQLRSDEGCICEVNVFANKNEIIDKWNIELSCYVDVAKYSNFLINLLGYTTASQKAFAEDISKLQNLRKDYYEEIGYFPKPTVYELNDPQFNKDKYVVIDIIRKYMQNIASKWQLLYKED